MSYLRKMAAAIGLALVSLGIFIVAAEKLLLILTVPSLLLAGWGAYLAVSASRARQREADGDASGDGGDEPGDEMKHRSAST